MTDRETMRKEVERQGLKIAHDPDALEIVSGAFAQVKQVFPDELKRTPITSLMVYDMAQQTEGPGVRADGIVFYKKIGDGRYLYAVAISTQAIYRGIDYVYFLFLHELAHVFVHETQERDGEQQSHSTLYEAMLNELINLFNRQTGANLSNDYALYGKD